jgi:hypothetical protein
MSKGIMVVIINLLVRLRDSLKIRSLKAKNGSITILTSGSQFAKKAYLRMES